MTKPKNGKIRSSCQSALARHGITHCLAIQVNELSNKLTKALSSRKKKQKSFKRKKIKKTRNEIK